MSSSERDNDGEDIMKASLKKFFQNRRIRFSTKKGPTEYPQCGSDSSILMTTLHNYTISGHLGKVLRASGKEKKWVTYKGLIQRNKNDFLLLTSNTGN